MSDYRPEIGAGVENVCLDGTTVLVTGATDGVGRETALALARLGANVLLHGRDRAKGERVLDAVREHATGELYLADYTSQRAVREFACAVRERHDALDVVLHNAGTHFNDGRLTEDGVEATFAVNHLAPFLLTHELMDVLAEDGRVVTVASDAHRGGTIDFERFRSVEGYDGLAAYRLSKLANILFTRELAARLDGPTANALHPGFVPGSGLWRNASLPVRLGVGAATRLPDALTGGVISTPAEAATTSVYLAASPDVAETTGQYFAECERVTPDDAALDADTQRRLWTASAALTGSNPTVP
ncbi:SDR family NAD(P)-dependent oxidoreductase [Salarchaeum sp. JOR-1]|uniref:SDR family NAD(P)-dependent oxidoreductase n=1 Tax=Salarchaeum sp. JOR-1 TaxID=2599399 RepID=UPI001198CA90|nr:SDR family NAD(P)-dependent oxidoreductase [Salarchaeum sp. JOR-1]QDX41388.1 SDR family NAD(P)-dependent oxidoreductase [Salarchaeum sp. JOR-1]